MKTKSFIKFENLDGSKVFGGIVKNFANLMDRVAWEHKAIQRYCKKNGYDETETRSKIDEWVVLGYTYIFNFEGEGSCICIGVKN